MTDKTVCFSGHRPEKLPGKGISDDEKTIYIKNLLSDKIENCIQNGYRNFLSGVARGIDLWAAMIVLEKKKENPDIRLICVKPMENQGYNFPEEDKKIYDLVISMADSVVSTSESYSRTCYMKRNKYMVDHSDLLIAFVKNYRSGTGQTINYAKKQNIASDITDLSDIEYRMKYIQLSL